MLASAAPHVIFYAATEQRLARERIATRGRIQPHVTCPTHVWEILENLPFLNRYDNYVDDGNGNCILFSTDVENTTVDGSIQLPVPNSQSTLAEANVTIDGTLDVAPSELAMAPGAEIDVAAGGTLNMSNVTVASASGTPQQGDWRGIAFWSGSTGVLDTVTEAGAGAGVFENSTGLCCAPAGIYIAGGADPTITNSTVDRSAGHGFEIDGRGSPTPTFSGDSVTNSGKNSNFYAVNYDNTPDVAGVNNFAASNDAHDSVRLPGGTVTGTLTLVNPGIPVQLDGTITIGNGGTLDVAQGAQLLFNFGGVTVSGGGTMSVSAGALFQSMSAGRQNAIYVDSGGTLTMTGTAASPIVLTSAKTTPQPGDWPGIAFWPGSTGSLDHVQVSYAGSGLALDPNLADCCINAGIYVNSGANPSITNTTVDYSSGNGFELDGQDLTAFSGDSASKNGGFAVYYDHTPERAGANLFSAVGNAHDSVRIPGGVVTNQLTLLNPGLPAQIDGTLTVTRTGVMTADDVSLLFTTGGIVVAGGGRASLVNSTQAQFTPGGGTASAIYVDNGGLLTMISGIVLTSAAATPHPGDWGGVIFWPGGRGLLYGVRIAYAGGGTNPDPSRQGFVHAGFYANKGAVTSVSQTTVDHSGGEGFELDGRNVFTGSAQLFSGNAATNNGDFAVYYDHTPNAHFANGFSGGGNVHDAVRLPGGTVSSLLTLLYPGLPAQIDGTLTVTRGATLYLGPLTPGNQRVLFTSGSASEGVVVSGGGRMIVGAGTQLQFTLGHMGAIYVDNGGTLNMTGTATSPISLTSASATPHASDWAGIAFWPGGTGSLSYVHLSYAGGNLYADPSRTPPFVNAGIYVNQGATPVITSTAVDHSLGNGFEIDGRGAAAFSSDVANGNTGFAAYYDHTPTMNGAILFGGSGNGHDAVRLPGGMVTGALALGSSTTPGLPVQIEGMLVVTSGASLAVNPGQQVLVATQNFGGVTVSGGGRVSVAAGVRVRFEHGRAGVFYVDSGGTLTMSGTATSPISLTSTSATPQPGDWGGIAFWPGGAGSLSHVHLSGAGFGVNDSPTHCCAYTSIDVNNAAPTILTSAVDTSAANDVEVEHGGLPVLHGDSFGTVSSSSYFGVVNDNGAAGPTVDATYNWWGSPSGPSGAGSGTGVPVSQGVNFTPWLTAQPLIASLARRS